MMTPSGPLAVLQIQFQVTAMTEHSLWRFSRALHAAINERQQQDLEPLLDEDVEWAIYGPIDMFPFLGAATARPPCWRCAGRSPTMSGSTASTGNPSCWASNSAASMMRYSLTAIDSNKPISLRLAHFAQFKAGRLLNIRVLIDTFDLVEQALGRPINLPKIAT